MSNSVKEFSELHEFFLGKFSLAATVLEGAKLLSIGGAKIFWVFYFSPSKTKKRSSRKFGLLFSEFSVGFPKKNKRELHPETILKLTQVWVGMMGSLGGEAKFLFRGGAAPFCGSEYSIFRN